MTTTTKERKAALKSVATSAIVPPGGNPFAALAAAADKLLAEAPDDEPVIDWATPQEVGRGLLCQVQGGMLLMAVNISDVAKRKAKPSKEGNMLLLASSAGFKALAGLGIKIGVNVGMANPNAPKKGLGSK